MYANMIDGVWMNVNDKGISLNVMEHKMNVMDMHMIIEYAWV